FRVSRRRNWMVARPTRSTCMTTAPPMISSKNRATTEMRSTAKARRFFDEIIGGAVVMHVERVGLDYSATDDFIKKSRDYGNEIDRKGPEIFVGEWGAHEDATARPWDAAAKKLPPTPSMKSAIGDGVFMAAMERNSDIITMQCYAPLFANVNPGAYQWRPNMIGYDALSAFGSPSYYAFQMFSRNVGDEILPVTPSETSIQGCATRDSKTGEIIVKLVNPELTPQ